MESFLAHGGDQRRFAGWASLVTDNRFPDLTIYTFPVRFLYPTIDVQVVLVPSRSANGFRIWIRRFEPLLPLPLSQGDRVRLADTFRILGAGTNGT